MKLITGLLSLSSPRSILVPLGYPHPHFHTAHRGISHFLFHLLLALKRDKLHVILVAVHNRTERETLL